MRLVRCDQCGAKALIAASQCPRCTFAFFLRDSRGKTVPMAHCRECDTYYPRSRGGCRWCGTKLSTFPTAPLLAVAGVAAAVGIVALGWWQFRSRSESQARSDVEISAPATAIVEPPPVISTPLVVGDTVPAPDSAALADTLSADRVPVATAPGGRPRDSSGLIPASPSPPTSQAANVVASAPVQPTSPTSTLGPNEAEAATPRPARRYAGPWTRAIAQQWVNVRVSATLDGAIVGVVTPNTTVQLGETRGGWRRVRTAGVEGWADASFFAADTASR